MTDTLEAIIAEMRESVWLDTPEIYEWVNRLAALRAQEPPDSVSDADVKLATDAYERAAEEDGLGLVYQWPRAHHERWMLAALEAFCQRMA